MPIELERKLRRQAMKMKRQGKKIDVDAYVFGGLRHTGWTPATQKSQGLAKR
jgi:hypothetical protein